MAVSEVELPALERIHERGVANGVHCTLINKARLAELEPYATGVRAIHVPETGIVNYRQVCERLAERVREAGGEILFQARVTAVRHRADSVTVLGSTGERTARQLVNCAGLHADRVARFVLPLRFVRELSPPSSRCGRTSNDGPAACSQLARLRYPIRRETERVGERVAWVLTRL